MLKITVVTPSFNQANYLEETIQSVIRQDYPDLDWIVIDGGSTDGSCEILKKYEKHFSYWVSEKDKGQSHAINKGFLRAKGDILTWLNSDDLLQEGALHKVNDYFSENPEINLLFGSCILFGENFPERVFKPAGDYFEARSLAGLPFPQPSSFFRKSCLDAYGPLNEKLHFGMDYDFFLQIFLNRDYLRTEEIFSRYRYHRNSKSVTQNARFATDYAFIFSKFINSLPYGSHWRQWLEERNLWAEVGEEAFFSEKMYDDDLLKKAVFFKLYNRIIFLYESLDTKKVYRLCLAMRELSPELFYEFGELETVRKRTRWLTPQILAILRKLKRS